MTHRYTSLDKKTGPHPRLAIFVIVAATLALGLLFNVCSFSSPCDLELEGSTSPSARLPFQGGKRPPYKTFKRTSGVPARDLFTTASTHTTQNQPIPTNSWYQNVLLRSEGQNPTSAHRVYVIPHIVDFAGEHAGIRILPSFVEGGATIVQVSSDENNALLLGGLDVSKVYQVSHTGVLGFGVDWGEGSMTSYISRGSPFVTMNFDRRRVVPALSSAFLPVSITIDGQSLDIADLAKACKKPFTVKKKMKLHFASTDFTWIVFTSRPTTFSCKMTSKITLPGASIPGVVPAALPVTFQAYVSEEDTSEDLSIRVALLNNCTEGSNWRFCGSSPPASDKAYEALLEKHVDAVPTHQHESEQEVQFTFPTTQIDDVASDVVVHFVWGVKSFYKDNSDGHPDTELLTYALAHHFRVLESTLKSSNVKLDHCEFTLHGPACLVLGAEWALREQLIDASFSAKHSIRPEYEADLIAAVEDDVMNFDPPPNYLNGRGDTYFSGKIFAKLARIITIAGEVNVDATPAVDKLRRGMDSYLDAESPTPFLWDELWGGIVHCGCNFEEDVCTNEYPNCPGLEDPGSNFGFSFFNDQHFHLGYFIHAAAVLTRNDPVWGRENFDKILVLIRNIANVSGDDEYFPKYRHKDVYLGSSWASGIALLGEGPYPNGRNQESSSEAIAAYEGIALYGEASYHLFGAGKGSSTADNDKAETSRAVRDTGRFLMTTEVRSAIQYWHVGDSDSQIYPKNYEKPVIGMLWSTMAQYQTWFGSSAYQVVGIQLLPVTPISEIRDGNIEWVRNSVIEEFHSSCVNDAQCEIQGWSILYYYLLAASGGREGRDAAVTAIKELDAAAFESSGGNGHSKSNSIWWAATRPF